MRPIPVAIIVPLLSACAAELVGADAPAAPATTLGTICHIGLTSDKVPDLSSIAAWKRAYIRDGMSDHDKALAIYAAITAFKQQDQPPMEFLSNDAGDVCDAIKNFNVYGYALCSDAAAMFEELARAVDLPVRGWGINGHSVTEARWDGQWHLLDSALMCTFPDRTGNLASVEQLTREVKAWYDQHPGYRKDADAKLRAFAKGDWRTGGPDVFAHTTSFDDAGAVAVTPWHGWWSAMQEYDGSGGGPNGEHFIYDYGYAQGYELDIRLRPGESLERDWSNRGLQIDGDLHSEPNCLHVPIGKGFMAYSRALGDLANQRVGNGTALYRVPLAGGAWRHGAWSSDNLADAAPGSGGPAVRVADATKPAELVIRMPSSYVYLGGRLDYTAAIGDGGAIAIAVSDDNGLAWKDVATPAAGGAQSVDLTPFVRRRYEYRLRFTLRGAGTGLDAIALRHDIQCSQRALPALGEGDNRIAFHVGPAEDTVTIEASCHTEWKDKQVVFTDFHPTAVGLQKGTMRVAGGEGSITFPVTTPGDLVRLRFGAAYRTRDDGDAWDYQVSFDGGATFATVGHAARLCGAGGSAYVEVDAIPSGTRSALVRYRGRQRNTTMLGSVRIDADYRVPEPSFAPVAITYAWKEGGVEKRDVHIARRPDDDYVIRCAAKPTLESVTLAVAAPGAAP